jgi:hypothetical protein
VVPLNQPKVTSGAMMTSYTKTASE